MLSPRCLPEPAPRTRRACSRSAATWVSFWLTACMPPPYRQGISAKSPRRWFNRTAPDFRGGTGPPLRVPHRSRHSLRRFGDGARQRAGRCRPAAGGRAGDGRVGSRDLEGARLRGRSPGQRLCGRLRHDARPAARIGHHRHTDRRGERSRERTALRRPRFGRRRAEPAARVGASIACLPRGPHPARRDRPRVSAPRDPVARAIAAPLPTQKSGRPTKFTHLLAAEGGKLVLRRNHFNCGCCQIGPASGSPVCA